MRTRILFSLLLGAAMTTAQGQSSVIYVNQPSFPDGFFFARPLDLNADDVPDFNFPDSGMMCTMDVPTSGCSWPFYFGCEGTNELQTVGYQALMKSFGAGIGSESPSGTAWSTPGFSGAGLLFYWWSRHGQIINGELVHSGWNGPLAAKGIGYLGVRFYAADGLHYGWIRVRMPNPNLLPNIFEFGPVVVDYAYESRPDTPIRAGDIGTGSDSIQFIVDFRNPDGSPHGSGRYRSVGTAILTSNTLRFELDMVGGFFSAALRGPAVLRADARAIFNFGQPLVAIHPPCTPQSCDPDFTVFFGEASLNLGQVVQLRRGAVYVSLDGGALVGRIRAAQ